MDRINFGGFLLKIVVCTQIILSTWSYLGVPEPFISVTYSYIHLILLVFGALSITKPGSADLVLMYLVINVFTILNDIILLGLFQPTADAAYERDDRGIPAREKNTYRFSLGMIILHLLLKPVICFILYKIYVNRGGDLRGEVLSITAGNTERSYGGYDNIDQNVETASPHQSVDNQS